MQTYTTTRLDLSMRVLMLNALKAVGGPLADAKLVLLKNQTPGSINVAADIQEADFTGYAAVGPLAFGTPIIRDIDTLALVAESVQFTATGDAAVNGVTGWAVTNAAKTAVYAVGTFSQSILVGGQYSGIIVNAEIVYGK